MQSGIAGSRRETAKSDSALCRISIESFSEQVKITSRQCSSVENINGIYFLKLSLQTLNGNVSVNVAELSNFRLLIDKTSSQPQLSQWLFPKAARPLMPPVRAATAFSSRRSAMAFSTVLTDRTRRAVARDAASRTSSSVTIGSAC